jgi:hypothetical protein
MVQNASGKSLRRSAGQPPTKEELQRQMEKTRESVAETVGQIKDTVNKQVAAAKETVAGVLDYREHFQQEPLVWSLGALSAGFALGYTMGYAHRETKGGRNQSQLAAFTNSMVDELSAVGSNVVMPTLNAHIKELFGFDFTEMLSSIGKTKKVKAGRRAVKKSAGKTVGKTRKPKAA